MPRKIFVKKRHKIANFASNKFRGQKLPNKTYHVIVRTETTFEYDIPNCRSVDEAISIGEDMAADLEGERVVDIFETDAYPVEDESEAN